MGTAKKYESNGPSAEDKALDRFAEMMIARIEALQSDWKKPWFTEGTLAWPKNLSGREYNGQNALMLMLHCEDKGYKLPVFMTFDRCVGLNYTKDKAGNRKDAVSATGEPLPRVGVNKGEKSFPVFITTFTCVHKETKERIKYDDYKQLSEDEKKSYNVFPRMQVYSVFNVDQTNLKEARPELYAQLEAANRIERPEGLNGEEFKFEPMDVMIRDNRWVCPIKLEHQDGAYYSISQNSITLPEKSQFMDGESFYGTAFHEMGHSTGAEALLNRFHNGEGNGGFGSADYAREELVAELTSALVAQRYGISKHLKEDSAAYLKAWLASLKESPDFIKTTLSDVKKASAILNQHIDKIQLELEKEKALKEAHEQGLSGGQAVPTAQNGEENRPGHAHEESRREDETQGGLRDLGQFDIPEWALVYLEYGNPADLSESEEAMVSQFCRKNFPNGFIMSVDWNNPNEFNQYPAFGERHEHALTNRGESPYLACKTYPVQFFDPHIIVRSQTEDASPDNSLEHEETAAMGIPKTEEEEPIIRHGRGR